MLPPTGGTLEVTIRLNQYSSSIYSHYKQGMTKFYFEVGNLRYGIYFCQDNVCYQEWLPTHEVFQTDSPGDSPLFILTVVDSQATTEIPEDAQHVGNFDNIDCTLRIYKLPEDGYCILVFNIRQKLVASLSANKHFTDCRVALNGSHSEQSFGLENSVMMAFAFAGCHRKTLLIHASVAVRAGKAYAFLGRSGTGKSTHCQLWLRELPETKHLNDDNPVVSILPDGTIMIYGSPWSGKTPIYKKEGYPAGGFLRLHQAPQNVIRRQSTVQAFASLLGTAGGLLSDSEASNNQMLTISEIIKKVKCYEMDCLPNAAAAHISYEAMAKDNGTEDLQ